MTSAFGQMPQKLVFVEIFRVHFLDLRNFAENLSVLGLFCAFIGIFANLYAN